MVEKMKDGFLIDGEYLAQHLWHLYSSQQLQSNITFVTFLLKFFGLGSDSVSKARFNPLFGINVKAIKSQS